MQRRVVKNTECTLWGESFSDKKLATKFKNELLKKFRDDPATFRREYALHPLIMSGVEQEYVRREAVNAEKKRNRELEHASLAEINRVKTEMETPRPGESDYERLKRTGVLLDPFTESPLTAYDLYNPKPRQDGGVPKPGFPTLGELMHCHFLPREDDNGAPTILFQSRFGSPGEEETWRLILAPHGRVICLRDSEYTRRSPYSFNCQNDPNEWKRYMLSNGMEQVYAPLPQ